MCSSTVLRSHGLFLIFLLFHSIYIPCFLLGVSISIYLYLFGFIFPFDVPLCIKSPKRYDTRSELKTPLEYLMKREGICKTIIFLISYSYLCWKTIASYPFFLHWSSLCDVWCDMQFWKIWFPMHFNMYNIMLFGFVLWDISDIHLKSSAGVNWHYKTWGSGPKEFFLFLLVQQPVLSVLSTLDKNLM